MNTTDEMGRALSDLAARADSDHRPDRVVSIHRRARRTARARAVGASVAAALVFGTGVALVARSQEAAAPIAPAGPVATHPSSIQPTHTATPPASTHASTQGTASASATLVPADARYPAAGACPTVAGAVVTIDTNPDVPTPRCVQVRADQRLRVVNTSNLLGSPAKVITVTFGDFAPRVLQVGQSTTFDRPFGDYLAVGDHRLATPPLYAGSYAEIYLP